MKKFNANMRLSFAAMMVVIFCSLSGKIWGQDLDPVAPNLQVIPAGSYVIAMDDTLQVDPTYGGDIFNIRAYGLLATILDNRIELMWAIRAGKAKDDTDFTAVAPRVFPTAQAATLRRFRAGPMIISSIDTGGLSAVINTFNAANTGHTINVYQLTTATTVDVRYTLNEKPRVGVLNDGGNAMIQLNYMSLASMPTQNYEELTTGANLTNPDTCFTFASEPHNDNPVTAVVDSIKSFVVNFGGNFLAECAAVPSYENLAAGRYQTTLGIVDQNPGNNDVIFNPHPDIAFTQYNGIFDGNAIGGSCHTYKLVTGSVFVNNGSKYDQYGLGADSIIMCQSMSKNGTGVGHLVFYTGGHNYGTANDHNHVNGMRSYFNAMFTPSNVQTCAFLIFNNDLAVTKTASSASLSVNQMDTFTMIIKNLGPSSVTATGVTAVDTIPSAFSFVSYHSSSGTSYNSSTWVWNVGTLALNQSDTLVIVAKAINGGTITNTVFINKDQYDFNLANDTARATVTVASCATVSAGDDTTICSGHSVTLGGNPTASGGTGTYTYSWSPTANLSSSTIANPLATPTVTTSYTVSVTSGNCTTSATVIVTVHTSPTITATSSSPAYCAGSTIDLFSNPSGGTGSYTYVWAGPASFSNTNQDPTIANSTTAMSGAYDVTITDGNSCTASAATPNITVNPNLLVNAGSGNPAYCSGNTLLLNSSASGGTIPFSYSWSGPNSFSSGAQNPSISGAIVADSGLYTVSVTDSKSCSGTASVNVTVHQSPSITATSGSPAYCSGATIFLSSNPSNGATPYGFSWSGPDAFSSTSQSPSRPNSVVAMSGVYDVTVTDNNGCSATAASGNVTVNPSPTITAGRSSPTYCAGETIQLTSNPSGGGGSYTFVWAGPATFVNTVQNPTVASATPSNSGTYSVTVTDANTCTASASTPNITVNPGLTVSLASNFVICAGSSATLTTSTTGGSSPFSYSWSNGAAPIFDPSVSPTSTTFYTVTVTDAKGCSGTATTVVTFHPSPSADAGPNQTVPACSLVGTTLGNTPTASGGTLPYTYLWSPNSGLSSDTVADPTVKSIGSTTQYTVLVTDSNGCTATSSATITITSGTLNVTITANAPTDWCALSGGHVTLTAIGQSGFPPYTTFQWTGKDLNSDTTQSVIANPDTAGTYLYTVVITDTTGCQAGNSTTITVLPSPTAAAGPGTDTICNGSTAILGGGPTATGGTPPYGYSWTGGAAPVANPTVTPSSTTTYTVVVTDSNNCSASASSTVVVRPSPVASAGPGQTLPTCSPTGITIGGSPTASGGSGGPYTYLWSPAVALFSPTNSNPQVIGLLTDTNYTVTVSDIHGCTASSVVTIDVVNNTPSVTIGALGSATWCAHTGSSATLTAQVTHGTSPFDYTWSGTDLSLFNSQSTTANPNTPNTYPYDVTVTDAFNCTASATINIKVDSTPSAAASNGGNNPTICSGTSVTIGGNPTASGGTPPYTFAWNNGVPADSNPTVTPVSSTVYIVTVTDSNGCTAAATTTVFVRPPLSVNAGVSQTINSCVHSCVQLGGVPTASGGSGGGYTYHWSPGANLNDSTIANPTACGLSSNTFYNVTVTDSTSCSGSGEVLISVAPSSLQADIEPGGKICLGTTDSVMLGGFPTAVGGTPPYTYTWSPTTDLNLHDPANPEASPTVTTTYDLTLSDAQGCVSTATAMVTVSPQITANAGTDTTVCAGFPVNLGGQPTATGGNGVFTYQWSPTVGLTNATISNPQAVAFATTTYFVSVTDGNGCSATGDVIINIHPTPTANAGADKTLTDCPLDSVFIGGKPAATGGTPPYTYFWTPSSGLDSATITNPSVKGIDSTTTYILFVTDSNGCVSTGFVTVDVSQTTLQAQAGNGSNLCSGGITPFQLGGSPTAVGGQPPYSYHWSPTTGLSDSTAPDPNALPATSTTYYVTVTDALGCTEVDSASLIINIAPVAFAGRDTAICNGASVVIGGSPTANGGGGGYTYNWTPGTGLNSTTTANPTASPTVTTNYGVTVTDRFGCSSASTITITVHPTPVANAGPGVTLTNCLYDSVQIGGTPSASGGTPGYTYLWSPSLGLSCTSCTNPYVAHIDSSTIYTLLVTDTNGCSSPSQVLVTVIGSTLQAFAGNGATFCYGSVTSVTLGGSPTVLGGSPPYVFAWSPSAGLSCTACPNPPALPSVTTNYIISITDHNGCVAVDSAKIFVSPQIIVNAGADTSICSGSSVALGGSPVASGGTGPYTYSWSPSTSLSSTIAPHPVAQNLVANATYIVTITDSLGCSASGSISINVRPLPTANAGPGGTIYPCSGDSLILGGNPTATGTAGPYSYSWSPPFNIALTCTTCSNPTVSMLGLTTQFCVTVKDTFGCQNTNCATVIAQPNTLFVNVGGPIFPRTLCSNVSGSCVNLGGSPEVTGGLQPYTYQWFIDSIVFSTAPKPLVCPTANTSYLLIVTDSVNCQSSDTVDVVVNGPPVVTISGLVSNYCPNSGNVVMTGNPSGGTFSGPGVTGNIFQPGTVGPGNYCITYTYTNALTGCTGDTTMCIAVDTLPAVSIGGIGPTPTYCQNDPPVTLIGNPAGGTFSGPGMFGNVFYPDSASIGANLVTYSYTDPHTGCTNTAQVIINVKGIPTLNVATSVDTACAGEAVILTPAYSPDVFNINWNLLGGGLLATGLNPVTVYPSGSNYCVVASAVNTPNGCIARDTVCIDVFPAPIITDPLIGNTCENQPVTLNIFSVVIDPTHHADVISVIVPPLHGTDTIIGGGFVTYKPAPYYHGTDSFTYAVCNSVCQKTCDTGKAYINICYVPYPPVIVDTTITIYENDTAKVCPLIYDNNNISLTIGNAACDTLNGQLIFTSDSCFEYIPTLNWVGTQKLCITVCDTGGLCDTGTVTVHVIPANQPPVAYPEHLYTCDSVPIGVNVSRATIDPSGNPLTYSYGPVNGPGPATWVTTSNGSQVFVADAPGTYTITYYVCNHSLVPPPSLCDSSTITITVINCNTTPHDSIAANNDAGVTNVGVPVVINELANDYYTNPGSLTVTIISGPNLGGATATIGSNGQIDYESPTPGIDTIEYQICDPAPLCATAIIVIFVDTTPGNIHLPPAAVNDYDSTNYQSPVTVPVLNNDHSPSGDSIHVTGIISGPNGGSAIVNPNGTITVTPGSGNTTNHPDTLVYEVCDVSYPSLCDTATVVVYIIPDKPPLAFPEHVYTCLKTPIGVNVAAATSDPYGDTLTFTYGTIIGPGSSTWVTTSPGAQVFEANVQPGDYRIPYTVCAHDPASGGIACASNVITVTVIRCTTVPNDSIAANNDGVVTNVGDTTSINELANDYYPDPSSLTVTIIRGPNLPGATAVINSNGSITYLSPTAGRDTLEYQICDPAPLCATAFIIITVDSTPANINVPPVAVNDYDSTNYQTPVTVPVLNNDYSPSGDSIYVTGVISGPANGTTFVNPNGTITYTPDSIVTTQHPDTFVYQVCEVANPTLCDTATVVVYIRPDKPPMAWPEHVYACFGTPIGVNVAAATSDPYGNALTFTYGGISGPGASSWVTTGNGAQVFVGYAVGDYQIPYTVCGHDPASGSTECASSLITVTVINCATAPFDSIAANNDGVVTNVGDTVAINELANDYYPNDTFLTVTILHGPDLTGSWAVINSNGTISYSSPTVGQDTIVYEICDPTPLCDSALIIITVDSMPSNIHLPPVAVNDYDSTNYETPVTVPVLSNDYSPSGDSIHVTAIPCTPNNGVAVINPNSTITYTPDSLVTPQHPDTFCYQVCDVQYPALCDTATVVIYIRAITRTPPYAVNDTLSTCKTTPLPINLFLKDTAQHGLTLTVTNVGVPAPNLGSITSISGGVVTFTPIGITGTTSFTYTVCDNGLPVLCSTKTIVIDVNNCQLPVVDTIYDTTLINTPGTACIGGYVNAGGNPWTIDSLCNPQNGTDSIVGPGDTCLVYIPGKNFSGNDTFCIVVCDTYGCTHSIVIYTVIDTVIKAVPIYCDMDSTPINSHDTIDVLAIDTIPKASDTTVTITTPPLNGKAAVGVNNTVIYVPDTMYKGTDEFIYEVCAITGSYKYCDTASVCVTVIDTTHHCIIPDGFSPNGDGVNDVYVLPCNEEYPAATLDVYSRWGDEVWSSNGPYQNNWDGKNQGGQACPTGTYFIIYNYNDGVHKSVAQFVVLNR